VTVLDRRRILGLAAALGAQAAGSISLAADKPSRRAEVEAYVRFAETTHPRGREAAADPVWRARADHLVQGADAMSYAAYAVRMLELAAWFGDGHTTFFAFALDQGPFALRTPLQVRAFYDGLYVVEAKDEASPLLGARITSVCGAPVRDLMQRFAAFWPANNRAWVHHDAGLLFYTPGLLHGLGLLKGADDAALPIEASFADGRTIRASLHPRVGADKDRAAAARTKSLPELWAAQAGKGNYVRVLADRGCAYVSFDDLQVPITEFMAFTREVVALADRAEVRRLIIDLRRNGGGNNFLAEPLRRELERSRFNVSGGLYLLIGPATFSAAQNFTTRVERETFALFVGEPSGGAPNHYGDGRPFSGPASGLRGQVSSLPWFDSYPSDHRLWTAPDLAAPRMFEDWRAGRDLPLETALSHAPSSQSEDSKDRVFYFDRESQKQAWTPFWLAPPA
jgi:hypothetical protein